MERSNKKMSSCILIEVYKGYRILKCSLNGSSYVIMLNGEQIPNPNVHPEPLLTLQDAKIYIDENLPDKSISAINIMLIVIFFFFLMLILGIDKYA